MDNPIACKSGARDVMVEILAGGDVAAGREDGGGRRTDENTDVTVGEEPVGSVMGQVRDEKGGLRESRIRFGGGRTF